MQQVDLVNAVSNKVQDSSYSGTEILSVLNRGVLEIAGGNFANYDVPLIAPLPDLLSSATVTTDTNNNVAMPATYHRHCFRVVDSDGNNVRIMDSYSQFLDYNPSQDNTGAVARCCIVGNTFYYNPIPSSAATLTLHFHRLPVDMGADDATPDGIQSDLHYRLLFNYACMEIYAEIEDGVEGPTPNTDRHERGFRNALVDLIRSIGATDNDAMFIEDESDYILDDY